MALDITRDATDSLPLTQEENRIRRSLLFLAWAGISEAGRLRCRLIETGISTLNRLKPCRASVKRPEHLNFSLLHASGQQPALPAAIRRRGE